MEYTVDVKEDGLYAIEAEVASTTAAGMFHLSEYGFDNLTFYTNITKVRQQRAALPRAAFSVFPQGPEREPERKKEERT